jgi:hypothetical protein
MKINDSVYDSVYDSIQKKVWGVVTFSNLGPTNLRSLIWKSTYSKIGSVLLREPLYGSIKNLTKKLNESKGNH